MFHSIRQQRRVFDVTSPIILVVTEMGALWIISAMVSAGTGTALILRFFNVEAFEIAILLNKNSLDLWVPVASGDNSATGTCRRWNYRTTKKKRFFNTQRTIMGFGLWTSRVGLMWTSRLVWKNALIIVAVVTEDAASMVFEAGNKARIKRFFDVHVSSVGCRWQTTVWFHLNPIVFTWLLPHLTRNVTARPILNPVDVFYYSHVFNFPY